MTSATAIVTPREHRRGILLMLGATLCWSIAGLLTRNSSIANGWEVTFWRSFYTAAFLAVVMLGSHGRGAITQIRAIGAHGAISGVLFAVMFTCFMLALTRTSTANTLVLTSTSPFYAAILGWLVLHERIPLRTWIAMPLAFAGITLMFADSVAFGAGAGLAGNLIALLVPLAFAANIIVIRRTGHHIDLLPTVMIGGAISAAVTLPFAMPFTANLNDHLLMLGLGVVQLGVGCVLMTRAARYLRATEIGLLSLLETILGPLWTWIGVGETPTAMTLAGGAIVIGALFANELAGLWLDPKPVTAP
jgi:drug/metabolite transporter (DMT)-like permease